MICISVTPTSRTLAKADLLNAARYGDIIELCLDHLEKEPNVKEMIKGIEKPMIISCRRPEEGGHWDGTDDERMMLLREAILANPAYIELDLESAEKIPRFGQTKRVISFTKMDGPVEDVDELFDRAEAAKADVVKFAWPTRTIDESWPLLAAVTGKRRLPIVGVGFGRAELTFSLLGRKYGSPWIYAALEKGMEAHPGQATVFELDEVYQWREIERKSVFIGVAGFGESQKISTRVLNAGFKLLGLKVHCLPIEVGDLNRLGKMLDILKVNALVVTPRLSGKLAAMSAAESGSNAGCVDLLLKKGETWKGVNLLIEAALTGLSSALGGSLQRKTVMVLGTTGQSHAVVRELLTRGALVGIVATNEKETQKAAGELGCRSVPLHTFYDTHTDGLVLCDGTLQSGQGKAAINPSYFRPPMAVLDLTDPPTEHPLTVEARDRGCSIVDASEVFVHELGAQFRLITGKELPVEAYAKGLSD